MSTRSHTCQPQKCHGVFYLAVLVKGRVTRCTDLMNTQTTIRATYVHQCREAFLKTKIASAQLSIDQVGAASDSRMKAHYMCPECLKLVHRLSGNSTHMPCRKQCVTLLVMKVPKADRKVARSTNLDSTQTVAANTQTTLKLASSPKFTTQRCS